MTTAKNLILLFILTLTLEKCNIIENRHCFLDEWNEYCKISDIEFNQINNFNDLLIKNWDTLKSSNLIPHDTSQIICVTLHILTQALKADSIRFTKYSNNLDSLQDIQKDKKLGFSYIYINLRDTTIDYVLQRNFCLEPKDLTVFHRLQYRQNNKAKYFFYNNIEFIKQMAIKEKWTYAIQNIEKHGF